MILQCLIVQLLFAVDSADLIAHHQRAGAIAVTLNLLQELLIDRQGALQLPEPHVLARHVMTNHRDRKRVSQLVGEGKGLFLIR